MKNITNELAETKDELIKTLSAFSQQQLNEVPFEGSWTAAQVAEHLCKSYALAEVLYGPVKPTERKPDESVKRIKEDLLNFDTKLSSPDIIKPRYRMYDKETHLHALSAAAKKIIEASKTLDLSETCTAFALPGLGELTRIEWIYFVIYHTKRHIHQVKKIYTKIQHLQNEQQASGKPGKGSS